ncbi:MAG TPA: hypothetical protein VFV38_01800 [Ktedonobacteraceae bacterium]|nr:hypothetical protein [Ktedonobacteraceae bacterium]
MVRIDTLVPNNAQTQGARRREVLSRQSPQHLENSTGLLLAALHQRPYRVSHSTLVLGAGACTEIPLAALVHNSDEVVLVDLDRLSMQQASAELATPTLRKAVRMVAEDLSGGISANLERLLARQPWSVLARQGARAIFDAAATCLEECLVPDPPEIAGLGSGNFGIVSSSLVLSQLFSYPLLDVLDRVQRVAPDTLEEQERHTRYQAVARAFRERVIAAHLHFIRSLLDQDGLAVLLCDQRGFVFDAPNPQHAAEHRRAIPLVPHSFFKLVEDNFTVLEKREWEWLTDMPVEGRYGRGYEVVGYLLR